MAEKHLNCIICPKCCAITWNGTRCIGAGCKRGEKFVVQELTSPRRTLTTTVKCVEHGRVSLIPIKSQKPVPLAEIADIVATLKKRTLTKRPEVGCTITIDDLVLIVTG